MTQSEKNQARTRQSTICELEIKCDRPVSDDVEVQRVTLLTEIQMGSLMPKLKKLSRVRKYGVIKLRDTRSENTAEAELRRAIDYMKQRSTEQSR